MKATLFFIFNLIIGMHCFLKNNNWNDLKVTWGVNLFGTLS
jgi:hypothetical protein